MQYLYATDKRVRFDNKFNPHGLRGLQPKGVTHCSPVSQWYRCAGCVPRARCAPGDV